MDCFWLLLFIVKYFEQKKVDFTLNVTLNYEVPLENVVTKLHVCNSINQLTIFLS